jgi:hypothetical protein
MLYPALLPLMRTPRLPVVEWTGAPADWNWLVRFADRRSLVSVRVPSHFKHSLPSYHDHNSIEIDPVRSGCTYAAYTTLNNMWYLLELTYVLSSEYSGLIPRRSSGRGVKLTSRFHILPRIRMTTAVSSLTHAPSRCVSALITRNLPSILLDIIQC